MDINDLDHLKDEKELEEIKAMESYLLKYINFQKAKNVGISFSPNDITMEDVNAFFIIDQKINDIKAKEKGTGH